MATTAKSKTKPTTAKKTKTKGLETDTRDARGVRKQSYKRFKPGIDYTPADDDMIIAMARMAQQHIRMGRPPKFETVETLQEKISEYWGYITDNRKLGVNLIPDVEGLGAYLGVSRETLNTWKNSNYRNFADTIKQTFNLIAAVKKQMAVNGQIPPIVFATDFNNNHGYTQKQEVVLTPNNPLGDQMDEKTLEETLNALPDVAGE